jgi:hypothetical protein
MDRCRGGRTARGDPQPDSYPAAENQLILGTWRREPFTVCSLLMPDGNGTP